MRSDIMRIDISNILNRSNKSVSDNLRSQGIKGVDRYVLPEKGQLLEGEILDILQNKVTIRLLNGQQMTAKMLEDFPFKIGDRLTFEIKDSTTEQLTLKPVIDGNSTLQNISDILTNAKLEETPQNIDIIKHLMEKNMPVNKETLQQLHMYTKRFPEAKIDTLIFLVKNNLIVSDESIQYVDQLLNDEQNISKDLTSLSRMASTLIKEPDVQMVLEKLVPPDQSTSILIKAAISLVQKDVRPPSQDVELPPQQLQHIKTTLRETVLPQLPEAVKVAVLEKMPSFSEIKTINELNTFFEKLPITEDMKTYIKEALAERLTENVLNQSMLLSRGDLERYENISKHFNKIYERFVDVLESSIQNESSQSGEKVLKEVQQLKTGIEVMNQLQQNFQFVHLPIMLNQQFVNSQLYIMNKKSPKKNNDERITALLRLDFKNLGHMDVYIAKHAKNVEVTFYVDGQDSERLLQENTLTLHKQLINKSFNVLGLGVRLQDEDLSGINAFFNEQKATSEPKRFTFDVRA